MFVKRHTVSITVDASGDATAYSPHIRGQIIEVQYVKDDFANGVDFTITGETTGRGIWTESDVNASKAVRPTDTVQDLVGADRAAVAGAPNFGPIYIDERVKIVIAQGGNATSGTFYITATGPTG